MRAALFGRFQTRLLLLFLSLFVLVQVATYCAVYMVTSRNLGGQARQHLLYSGETLHRAIHDRADKLVEGAAVLSTDFGFREAVATGDSPTILSALVNLAQRIGAQRAMLVSLDRQVVADTGGLRGKPFPLGRLVDLADEHGRSSAFVVLDGALYNFVVVPVMAPVPIAWVGLGTRIDDAQAVSLKALMPRGMDINFVHRAADGNWRVLASTLPLDPKSLDALPRPVPGGNSEPVTLAENGSDYLTLAVDLPDDGVDQGTFAVLRYSLDVAFGPYRTLVFVLLGLLALGLIVVAVGGALVARTVSRPLHRLAEAASKVSRGDYQPVEVGPRRDEFAQLSSSFNRMVSSIDEREKQITFQAEHDSETGLPNRRRFERELEALIGPGGAGTVSVIVVTVDRVNEVRNAFGYSTWDKLIALIGPRLAGSVPGERVLARLSTVSFILALPGCGGDEARSAAERIRSGFEEPFVIDGFTIDANAQIGIANHPEHASTVGGLIQKASIGVMQAQSSGLVVGVYDPERDSSTARRLSLMGDLRRSLANREVQFYYQPKIHLPSGTITQVEALVRWIHPELGFVPPVEFITLAEQTGHIGYLTAWALESAIRQCAVWREMDYPIRVAINLSAQDLSDRALPATVAALLSEHDIDPSWLVLEVTESAVMKDPEQAIKVLEELNRMNVTLSVDDYGTGYSSMGYLKKLPIQELKIDRSFVLNLASSPQDQILVRSTIEMGHSLGLHVTAEGVEDEASAKLLREFGCDLAQGYYYSRPVPVDELNRFIEESPWGLGRAAE